MKKIILMGLLILLYAVSRLAVAAVILQNTRVVIYPGEKEGLVVASIPQGEEKVLQIWLGADEEESLAHFSVMPGLALLKPGASQHIKVIYQGIGAAVDRESLFYLNIQDNPAVVPGSESKNTIHSSFLQVIKVFYRPDVLKTHDPLKVPLGLKWKVKERNREKVIMQLENPSPFYVVFDGVVLAGVSRRGEHPVLIGKNTSFELLPPFVSTEVVLECFPGAESVTEGLFYFITINDFGSRDLFVADVQDNKIMNVKKVLNEQGK